LNAPGDNVLAAGRGGFGGGGRGGFGGGGRGGGGGGGGGGQGSNAERTEVCPTCGGEKNAWSDDLSSSLERLIQIGTRTIWAPTTDERTRAGCRNQVRAILRSLNTVGPRFDEAFNTSAAANVMQGDASLPRSVLFRAQVKGHADGPDGKYLLLAPLNADVPVTVQVDDMMQLGGRSNLSDRRDPADGSTILRVRDDANSPWRDLLRLRVLFVGAVVLRHGLHPVGLRVLRRLWLLGAAKLVDVRPRAADRLPGLEELVLSSARLSDAGLNAEQSMVTQADQAMQRGQRESTVDLRADGKVMVRGEDVLLRAKGTQRIRAGTVAIN
jgi:hypothetical protein